MSSLLTANEVIASAKDDSESDNELNELENDKDDFGDWQAEDGEEDDMMVKSFFCGAKLNSIAELIEHDKNAFKFDFATVVKTKCTDDFSYIKTVNFIRYKVNERLEDLGIEGTVEYLLSEISSGSYLLGEEYLKPFLENDPLLFMFDELFEFEENDT